MFHAANVVRRVGYIHFPHLMQIALLRDYLDLIHASPITKPVSLTAAIATEKRVNSEPCLNSRSKIFELSSIYDVAKVYGSRVRFRAIKFIDFVFVVCRFALFTKHLNR